MLGKKTDCESEGRQKDAEKQRVSREEDRFMLRSSTAREEDRLRSSAASQGRQIDAEAEQRVRGKADDERSNHNSSNVHGSICVRDEERQRKKEAAAMWPLTKGVTINLL